MYIQQYNRAHSKFANQEKINTFLSHICVSYLKKNFIKLSFIDAKVALM